MKTQNVYYLKQAQLSIDPKFLLIIALILFLGFYSLKAKSQDVKQEKTVKAVKTMTVFSRK
jgi:hypothetical protein